jgi:hypothetical protein
MADQPQRRERFTMLEPKSPNTPLPGSETWPVVDCAVNERFTMLEPKSPKNPAPEELAAREAVPPAVQSMIVQLADAIGALEPHLRAAAVAELQKRLAG